MTAACYRNLKRRLPAYAASLAPDARLKELVGDPEGQRRHHEQRRSPPVATRAQNGAGGEQPDTNDRFHTGKGPGVAIGECFPEYFMIKDRERATCSVGVVITLPPAVPGHAVKCGVQLPGSGAAITSVRSSAAVAVRQTPSDTDGR